MRLFNDFLMQGDQPSRFSRNSPGFEVCVPNVTVGKQFMSRFDADGPGWVAAKIQFIKIIPWNEVK
jgi:hypothetical protein